MINSSYTLQLFNHRSSNCSSLDPTRFIPPTVTRQKFAKYVQGNEAKRNSPVLLHLPQYVKPNKGEAKKPAEL